MPLFPDYGEADHPACWRFPGIGRHSPSSLRIVIVTQCRRRMARRRRPGRLGWPGARRRAAASAGHQDRRGARAPPRPRGPLRPPAGPPRRTARWPRTPRCRRSAGRSPRRGGTRPGTARVQRSPQILTRPHRQCHRAKRQRRKQPAQRMCPGAPLAAGHHGQPRRRRHRRVPPETPRMIMEKHEQECLQRRPGGGPSGRAGLIEPQPRGVAFAPDRVRDGHDRGRQHPRRLVQVRTALIAAGVSGLDGPPAHGAASGTRRLRRPQLSCVRPTAALSRSQVMRGGRIGPTHVTKSAQA